MSDLEPEGPVVSSISALAPDLKIGQRLSNTRSDHSSKIYLTPLTVEHTADLHTSLGGTGNARLYRYLPTGPHDDIASFTTMIKLLIESPIIFPLSIVTKSGSQLSSLTGTSSGTHQAGTAIGIITLLNASITHRSIEIGWVIFGPSLQRTTAATEAFYLLMKYCFEDLHYLRVEWKANDRNRPSKRAAERLGFVFEGVFRKHMIVKGRSRDSAWFSITDEEWLRDGGVMTAPGELGVKPALEMWLENANFDENGKQKMRLEDFRKNGES